MNIFDKDYLNIQDVGNYAKQLRINAGISQQDMAKLICTSQPNISAAEKSKNTRYIHVAINIIEYLTKTKIEGPYYKLISKENE